MTQIKEEVDAKYTRAERFLSRLAGRHQGFKLLSGRGVAPPWLISTKNDRVVAYHGFSHVGGKDQFVGWVGSGGILALLPTEIVAFLEEEFTPGSDRSVRLRDPRTKGEQE